MILLRSSAIVARLVGFQPLIDRQLRAEIALDRLRELGHVPILLGSALRQVLLDELRDHVLASAHDRLGDILRAHEIGALLIDDAALIVGDVVVLEQLLAGIEVVLLDRAAARARSAASACRSRWPRPAFMPTRVMSDFMRVGSPKMRIKLSSSDR